ATVPYGYGSDGLGGFPGPAGGLAVRDVGVPSLDEHVLVLDEVEPDDNPSLDVDERRRAGVLGQPDGAAHGSRGVLALAPELALARDPEMALLLRRRIGRAPLRAGEGVGKREEGDRLLGLLLR